MVAVRRLLIIFTALFLTGFYFGPGVLASLIEPGSHEDPVVTKTWTDNYINEQFSRVYVSLANLDKKVADLESRIKASESRRYPVIVLTIGQKTAQVGGESRILDVAPSLIAGRTFLPLRFVGESLGAQFLWDGKTKKITYLSGNNQVELTVGERIARVNGRSMSLDVAPVLKNNRTLVPLRFVGESLGANVTWNGKNKTVEIR